MTKPQTRLSVTLWEGTRLSCEDLKARIREVAPLADVQTVEPISGHPALWVGVEEADTDPLDDLLYGELETSVYGYRWYRAERQRPQA